ncbi:unnamed protein product [Ceutorhynchus assimilis]|uniref:N-acetyltransferase domain-containing protein n=1 Tax=Ceutorhynchus assimilis TaxID=467358 RepID=A0A9N9MZF4_9CUCU|nr:unnamed protein product [Ceutorhynchus assimilis]
MFLLQYSSSSLSWSKMDDILTEMSISDLEKLAKMYENRKKSLPHLYSFLRNCLKAKGQGMKDFVRVFALNDDSWKSDGTFIASMPNHGHDIVLHSLDPLGQNLMKALRKTRKFKYLQDPARNYTFFYAVHEQFAWKIMELLLEQNQEILSKDFLNMWVLDKEKATKIESNIQGVFVEKIQEQDLKIVNENWQFRYPESQEKLLDWFKLNQGSGVYQKSDKKLVSWVVASCLGQMSALGTLPGHEKQGYGTLAVRHMAKKLSEDGLDCCATVYPENTVSERLLTKIGFRKMFRCQFIAVCNKN